MKLSHRFRMNSPRFVRFGIFLVVLLGLTVFLSAFSFLPIAHAYTLTSNAEQLDGPASPVDFETWLEAMKSWRTEQLAAINYDGSNYSRPELQWAQHSYVQPQAMIEDRDFYDPITRSYTVNKYLNNLKQRYGGIDSVLVWPTYPNIGIDDRNTDDMFRSMPGGVSAVQQMITDFHNAGVQVLFPIHPWDNGTRDPGAAWSSVLPSSMAQFGADGMNGDTMGAVDKPYFDNSVADGRPQAYEPEIGLAGNNINQLGWNVMSWGYWSYPYIPMVSKAKWLEPHHLVHVNARWSNNKTDLLQYAFFNGVGLESWENIWGIWNQMTDRDSEALRRVATIEREFTNLLLSPGWEPHTPTVQSSAVFASKWPSSDNTQVLWTLVNRSNSGLNGNQLNVDYNAGWHYYDLWHGVELTPQVNGSTSTLSFPIESNGYGAILAGPSGSLPANFNTFLAQMNTYAQKSLSSFSASNTFLPQWMTTLKNTDPATSTPAGMVSIPATNDYNFKVSGIEIEGGNLLGVDVQYPWENEPWRDHQRSIPIKAFYIDQYNVTNTQFKQFLGASSYQPTDSQNFLKDWSGGNYPGGWNNKPVTWVSLEDARAFCSWAGKRLPHEWEWQYAAQGTDGRPYPWGTSWNTANLPNPVTGRNLTSPSDTTAFAGGASPFGVQDLMGNVWQWTDEYTDQHTRAAILRGPSYYEPQSSPWYFPWRNISDTTYSATEDHGSLTEHGKYLLIGPGRDRSGTVGFRCVKDASASSGGQFNAALNAPAGTVDLTSEGVADWVHWGLTNTGNLDRKAGVPQQIPNYTVIGNNPAYQYNNNPNNYNWSDGEATSSATNTTTGVFTPGIGNGFQLVLPADTTPRTLKLYVGAWKAQGQLTATLSDGSTTAYTDSSLNNSSGSSNGVYTIHYQTPHIGQTLTVQFTVANSYDQYGNITLQAATIASNVAAPPTVVNLSNEGTLDWAHWGLTDAGSYDHKSGVPQQISYNSVLNGGWIYQYSDNPNAYIWSDSTQTTSTPKTTTGVSTYRVGSGFQLSVPADTSIMRTLKVYVGVNYGRGQFSASLSDGSMATYTDNSLENINGSTTGVYTIAYKAATAGAILTVNFTLQTDYTTYGNVTLQAATLANSEDVITPTGTLSVNSAAPPPTLNLSREGITDWAHWGLIDAASFNHTSGISQPISNYTKVGNGTVYQYSNNPNSYTWAGGTPTDSATNTTTGIFTSGTGNGFQLVLPADTTSRTLKLYVGAWKAQGQLSATLSDGSASSYIDNSLDNTTGTTNRLYTIVYKAGSAGQTLTLQWTVKNVHDPNGNVTLQAADLS